jgi:hypothetical protein
MIGSETNGSAPARPPIAYLVLSHTHPELVARLSDRLLRGDDECHVMVDHESSAPALEDWLPRHPRLRSRVSERPGGWGGYGLVSAVVEALAAIRRDLDPAWVVLLSGQDYPVQPPRELRSKLESSSADVHLTILRQVPERARGGLERWWHVRYFFRWWTLPRLLPPVLPPRIRRRAVHALHRLSMAQGRVFLWSLPRGSGTRIGVPRARTPFSKTYPCWAAYQWFAVSRRGLETLEHELSSRPELVQLYQTSVIPDESMVQTVLVNADDLVTAQPNLTFQRPTGEGDAHAADLTLDDLQTILASGRAFARKMHPDRSRTLMDTLDERLGLGPTLTSPAAEGPEFSGANTSSTTGVPRR